MADYNPQRALMELAEEATLPTPVHLRDMIFRAHLSTEDSIVINRCLQGYLKNFGAAQEKARTILQKLSEG